MLAKIKWLLLYGRPLVVDDRRGSSPFLTITRRRDETFRRGAIMPRNHAACEHKSSRWRGGVREKGVAGTNFRANCGHACLDARSASDYEHNFIGKIDKDLSVSHLSKV